MGFQYCRELTLEELRARSVKLKAEGKPKWVVLAGFGVERSEFCMTEVR